VIGNVFQTPELMITYDFIFIPVVNNLTRQTATGSLPYNHGRRPGTTSEAPNFRI
jgi:hypothetical protein